MPDDPNVTVRELLTVPLPNDPEREVPVVTDPFSKLTQNDLVSLAREVARNLKDLPVVLKGRGLTEDEFTVIKTNPWFERVLSASIAEWEAASNTGERVKLQSQTLIEDVLPVLGARMKDKNEDLNKAVEAVKTVAKLAGLGERDTVGLSGDKISININLGGGETIHLEKDVTPVEAQPVAKALPPQPQGAGDSQAVPAGTKVSGS